MALFDIEKPRIVANDVSFVPLDIFLNRLIVEINKSIDNFRPIVTRLHGSSPLSPTLLLISAR